MPYLGVTPAAEFTSKDLNGEELILDANGNTTITADTDDQIDIRIAGADDFQFTPNTFTAQSGSTIAAQALTGTTGVFSSDVTGLTINATGDTAASDNAAIGYTAAEGLILTGQGSTNDITIKNDADADVLTVATGGTTAAFLGDVTLPSAGELFVGDTANGNTTTGLTINQGASDDEIFALKSSDVAHGLTARTETDTFMAVKKYSADDGGALILGFNESITSVTLRGEAVAETSTKSTSAEAPVRIDARVSGAFISADNNIMNIEGASGHTKFIFDSDGDFHADSSSTTFDSYDDAQLARTFDLSHNRGVIASKFDKFISYNHEKLANLEIVGREEDGSPNHFINVTGMQRLHNGAIWQQYEKHENLLNAVYELAVEAVGEDKANEILDKNEIKLLSKNELLN